MKILVASCDNHADTFEAFHHCMEKYWPDHPKVVYSTESVENPYYTTVCKNYPLSRWSKRIRETLETMRDKQVLLMVDDCFIRRPVDTDRIAEAQKVLKDNVAYVNFEKKYDQLNDELQGTTFFKRRHGAPWEVSIQCGLWDRKKLIHVLEEDMDPWQIEARQPSKGYDFLINGGDYIIDYGYVTHHFFGITRELWTLECLLFFEKEGIKVDTEKRGVI